MTLCEPMDYSVHGILHVRILEWVAFPLLQGNFSTQGSNPGLPNWQAGFFCFFFFFTSLATRESPCLNIEDATGHPQFMAYLGSGAPFQFELTEWIQHACQLGAWPPLN